MKNIIAIFLLLLFTVTQTPAGQLLKLPLLIEHFNKHSKQDGFSLGQFLQGHYLSSHQDSDQSEDEELPFKSLVFQVIGSAVIPGDFYSNFSIEYNTIPKIRLNEIFSEQMHLFSIFRPPRV